ncbi:MAG: 4Fe-4S binding protein [bacterium]|nr:4Fe-4S binding protein [bacterium]
MTGPAPSKRIFEAATEPPTDISGQPSREDKPPRMRLVRRGDRGESSRLVGWIESTVGKKGDRSYRLRLMVQAGFALGCVVLGIQFARFTRAAAAGELPLPVRPPGVEGFLPISGMMGLLDWFYQGTLNRVHPAATMLFVMIVAVAFVARKSFCSWICPVGFLSESLARLGRSLFGRNFRPWKWLDIPLRGLKYLLLFFFVYAVVTMSDAALRAFIESPYNRVADVKMGLFFVRLGTVGASVLVVLFVLSILINGAWCRYLCPYGGLLGLVSMFSPFKVSRQADACIDCGLCDKVCMARLPVSQLDRVSSAECTGCLDCIATCPVSEALDVRAARRWKVGLPAYALVVLVLFVGGYSGARLADLWKSGISDAEYSHRIQNLDRPEYGHPGS